MLCRASICVAFGTNGSINASYGTSASFSADEKVEPFPAALWTIGVSRPVREQKESRFLPQEEKPEQVLRKESAEKMPAHLWRDVCRSKNLVRVSAVMLHSAHDYGHVQPWADSGCVSSGVFYHICGKGAEIKHAMVRIQTNDTANPYMGAPWLNPGCSTLGSSCAVLQDQLHSNGCCASTGRRLDEGVTLHVEKPNARVCAGCFGASSVGRAHFS